MFGKGGHPAPPPGDAPQGNWWHGNPPGPPGKGKGKGKGKEPEPEWWNRAEQGQEEPQGAWVPPDPQKRFTTLGLLKHVGSPWFAYLEFWYLLTIREFLTIHRETCQTGNDVEAIKLWHLACLLLELDHKAVVGLMLLCHSGLHGRTLANEILWKLLSEYALQRTYEDLSHKCTNMVGWARRDMDRPPRTSRDRLWWRWRNISNPQRPQWSPRAPPERATYLCASEGLPQAPPACWGPPERLQ